MSKTKKKILVVDDDQDVIRATSLHLTKAGFTVVTAVNGKLALENVPKESPDLILLDLGLPDMDGQEVCRRIKADDISKHIPVIVFTARYSTEIFSGKEPMAIDGYLVKPFEPEELLDIVKTVLSK